MKSNSLHYVNNSNMFPYTVWLYILYIFNCLCYSGFEGYIGFERTLEPYMV